MVHAYRQRHNSVVVYLWAKEGNREFSSKILVSPNTVLEGTSRDKYNFKPQLQAINGPAEGGGSREQNIHCRLHPYSSCIHQTDNRPTACKVSGKQNNFVETGFYVIYAWHCNRIQIWHYITKAGVQYKKSFSFTVTLCPSFSVLPLAPFT